MRNGLNLNPVDYACLTAPVIGTNWLATIATTGSTTTTIIAFAPGGPDPGTPFLNGELLIQLTPFPFLAESPGGFYGFLLPNDVSLIGLFVATQGARVDGANVILLNAIDLVIGL